MVDLNTQLLDDEVRHAVGLHRYSNGVVRRIVNLLNESDRELVAKLIEYDLTPGRAPATRQRLARMLEAFREIIQEGYNSLEPTLRGELMELASYEVEFQAGLFENRVPIALDLIKPSVEQLAAAVTAQPFQGALLREWAESLESDAFVRVRNSIRLGFTQGETIDEMVRRLRGTRAKGFADGILEINRRNAEAVVRTAVSHVATNARMDFFEANADLVKATTWAATLDMRTTPICRVRDGLQYTLDGKPLGHKHAWLGGPGKAHWQCRSTPVPVIKSWQELGIDIEEAPPATRASMTGQVPETTNYQDWMKRQSAELQDDVLGPTRGALFRRGDLTLDKFVDRQGRQYTLKELREREAEAFARANLAA